MKTMDMIIDLETRKVTFEPHLSGSVRNDEHNGRAMSYVVPSTTNRTEARLFVVELLQRHDLEYDCKWNGSNWIGKCNPDAMWSFFMDLSERTYNADW